MSLLVAGIKVADSAVVHDAIELARSSSSPFLFNHVMRSWLFGVLIAEGTQPAPDPEILAVSAILHDLGLTDRFAARKPETTYDNILREFGTRFVDGYNAPSFADLIENAPFAE